MLHLSPWQRGQIWIAIFESVTRSSKLKDAKLELPEQVQIPGGRGGGLGRGLEPPFLYIQTHMDKQKYKKYLTFQENALLIDII